LRAFRPDLPVANGFTRRQAVRYGAFLIAAASGLAMRSADAARGWCRSDPLILIDGIIVDIFCTAPLTALLKVTGPTEIVITVPQGVKTTLLLAGIGFGRGEKVRFATSNDLTRNEEHIDVKVEVTVPAKEDLPIGVEFAPRILGILNPARAEGFANHLITLDTVLADGGLDLGIISLSAQSEQRIDKESAERPRRKRRRHKRN
jgi:hypothetical protein